MRQRVIEQTRVAIGKVRQQGLSHFSIIEGSIGNAARAMGGASLPLLANFTQDREVLFKDDQRAGPTTTERSKRAIGLPIP